MHIMRFIFNSVLLSGLCFMSIQAQVTQNDTITSPNNKTEEETFSAESTSAVMPETRFVSKRITAQEEHKNTMALEIITTPTVTESATSDTLQNMSLHETTGGFTRADPTSSVLHENKITTATAAMTTGSAEAPNHTNVTFQKLRDRTESPTFQATKTTSKALDTTSKAADTTSKAADTTSEAADTTSEAADTTSEAADTTSEAADTTSKAADITSRTTDRTSKTTDTTSKAADTMSEAADTTSEAADTTSKAADITSRTTDRTSKTTDTTSKAADTTSEVADTKIFKDTTLRSTTTPISTSQFVLDTLDTEESTSGDNFTLLKPFTTCGNAKQSMQPQYTSWLLIIIVCVIVICVLFGVILLFVQWRKSRRSQKFGPGYMNGQSKKSKKKGAENDAWAGPVHLEAGEGVECEGDIQVTLMSADGNRDGEDMVLSTFVAMETDDTSNGGVGGEGTKEAKKWEEQEPLLYIDEEVQEDKMGNTVSVNENENVNENLEKTPNAENVLNGGEAFCITTAV